METGNLIRRIKPYRYVLIILLLGIALMCLPDAKETVPSEPEPTNPPEASMTVRLEQILSQVAGVGKVSVLLTEAAGEEVIYQMDDGGEDTVLITDADRREQGLIRSRQPPVYRGAVIVCQGAANAAVRLAVVEAVTAVTGLTSDKITVLEMK